MVELVHSEFYTPAEVASHDAASDVWISFLGQVYDVTAVVRENEGTLTQPLVRAAGTDVSHWFDATTGDLKTRIDPEAGDRRYFLPMGRFVGVPESGEPAKPGEGGAWWRDGTGRVGKLSTSVRRIKLLNTLTQDEHELEVPSEETIQEILVRYLPFNAHAASYAWKCMGRQLDKDRTLQDNGILDERELYAKANLPDDFFVPLIHVYYTDDLTVA